MYRFNPFTKKPDCCDALGIRGVPVDDSEKENGKILKYNGPEEKLEYKDEGGGGGGGNPSPDYDSDWVEISPGETKELTHNLGTDKLRVDLMALDEVGAGESYAHWHLNESSGTNVSDSSGNGRDGTTQNMEDEDWVAGKLNNCLQFDGADEYVNCGDIANFEKDVPVSYECWFNTPDSAPAVVILSKYDGTSKVGWYLSIYAGKIYFYIWAGSMQLAVYDSGSWDDGVWHHLIVTYDGSSSASGIHFYVDGEDRELSIGVDALTTSILNTANFQISSKAGANYFLGKIDEVVIYEKELSQAEVTVRWNNGNGTEDIPGEETKDIIHNKYYGDAEKGFYISKLTESKIFITRMANNPNADKIRVRIWNYA